MARWKPIKDWPRSDSSSKDLKHLTVWSYWPLCIGLRFTAAQVTSTQRLSRQKAVAEVHKWNPRKKQILKPEHIHIAWKQLADRGWIGQAASPKG